LLQLQLPATSKEFQNCIWRARAVNITTGIRWIP